MPKLFTAALIVLAVLAAGCSSAPAASSSAAPPTTLATASPTLAPTQELTPSPNTVGLPNGWTRRAGDGFSIGLPDSWESISAADIANSDTWDALRDANPDAGAVIDQAETAMSTGQVQMFAFDPGPRTLTSGFANNVNVIHVGDPGDDDLASIAEQVADAVALQVPVEGQIRTSTTTLPAGQAAVLRYRWTVNTPGQGSFEVAVTQYLIVTDGDGYIVTLSGLRADEERDRPIWEAMATSFRFG
jgi:hypothetical protein